MNRGKRLAPITLHAPTPLKLAIRQAAKREDRTVSTYLLRLAEREPTVQVFLQQIEGSVANN